MPAVEETEKRLLSSTAFAVEEQLSEPVLAAAVE
jgi:hypothetical protein